MPTYITKGRIMFILAALIVLSAQLVFGQSDSLVLSSGAAGSTGAVSLNLTLTSPTGSEPAAVEWTLSYSPSDVTAISATIGTIPSGAGKSLTCAAGTGTYTCVASGMNANIIPNGAVAVVNITIGASVSSTAIGVTNSVGATGAGGSVAMSQTGGTITGYVSPPPPTLTALSCSPATVPSAGSSTCTVTISSTAPTGGTQVSLASNNAALTVPTPVTVAANSITATFTATAGTVSTTQTPMITATLGTSKATASLTITPPPVTITVSSVTCNYATMASNSSGTVTVTLSSAPTVATAVSISSNNAALTVPTPVTVAANSATATFTATAGTVSTNQTAVITATLGTSKATASVTITPPPVTITVSSLACNPTTLASTASSTCTVTISSAAPSGGTAVALASNNAALTVSTPVTVAANSITATFTATAGTVSATQTPMITATLGTSKATASVTITPPPVTITVSSVACNPTTLASKASSTCTVTISSAAPSGGTAVALASNNAALTVPTPVTVVANSITATFTATAGTVSTTQTPVITATLGTSKATASLTITPPSVTITVSSVTCNYATMASNSSGTVTVTLSSAPTVATAVSISSNNAALTVPTPVTVAANSATATFTATAGTVSTNQTAVITATLGTSTATASVTITPVTVSSLACNPTTLASNAATTCTVTISSDPSGGTPVALASNNAALTVSTPVTVAATSITATFTATAGTVSTNQTAAITATLNGSSVTASISLVGPSTSTYSIWTSTSKPTTVSDSDTVAVELGLRFQANVAGHVTGVRFYKGTANKGTHLGHLWSNTGALLASVTFTNETASGWQQASFASPVAITANTPYVISYLAPAGRYSDDTGYFSASALTNGPLTALRDGQNGPNGAYQYGSSVFPNAGWESSNYWVDVVFAPNGTTTGNSRTSSSATSGGQRTAPGQTGDTSSLSCYPRVVDAGGSFNCELKLTGAPQAADLSIESSSSNVTLPAATRARANQHSLSFQGSVSPSARQESITVSATAPGRGLEDTVMTVAASGPVIRAPLNQLVKYGTPIDFKVSVNSIDPAPLAAAGLPAGASFDNATGRFDWTPGINQQGAYDVTFTTKGPAAAATRTVHIDVDAGIPSISNASKFGCSPSAVANLSGKWLGPDEPAADPSGNSTELGGTTVRVNGTLVPLLYAGKTQASFLCPAGAPGDALQIVLETPSGATTAFNTTTQAATPFLLSAGSGKQGLIFVADTTELATVRDVRGAGQPAQPGDSLSIRATGLGENLPVSVKIGDAYAQVLSIAPVENAAGVWNIRVAVPAAPNFGDAIPVQLEMASSDGRPITSNSVMMAIEPVRQ